MTSNTKMSRNLMTLPLDVRNLIWEYATGELYCCSSRLTHRVSVKWFNYKTHRELSLNNPVIPLLLINQQARDEICRLKLDSKLRKLTFCSWHCASYNMQSRPTLLASYDDYQIRVEGILTVPNAYRNEKSLMIANPRRDAYKAMVENQNAFEQFAVQSVVDALHKDPTLGGRTTPKCVSFQVVRFLRQTPERYTVMVTGETRHLRCTNNCGGQCLGDTVYGKKVFRTKYANPLARVTAELCEYDISHISISWRPSETWLRTEAFFKSDMTGNVIRYRGVSLQLVVHNQVRQLQNLCQ